MNNENNRHLVLSALDSVHQQARINRAMILTESDLKCRVFLELNKIYEFGTPKKSFDPEINGCAVHTETKFFDTTGLLRRAPDLIITDPAKISIKKSLNGNALPSKGFHFDGSAILIELKFLKRNACISNSEVARIEDDIRKGIELNERGNLDFFLFIAIYDRFDYSGNKLREMFSKHPVNNIQCMYYSAGTSF